MADIVVYDDSPLAQYLQEIQGEQHGTDLQHTTVPVHEPEPQPEFIGFRLAHNAVDMLAHLVEYLTHTFSSSAADTEDAEFEERFKYFICTSPFLNRTVTLHSHERGRRTDVPMTVEYASKFNPGRFGYALGFGTLATLVARSVLTRTRVGRLPWMKPFLSRSAAVSVALASSAWMLRILQRRNIQATQNQALRSLQILVNHCQALDAKVNRAIMVIQEIELVSRGYRLSTPLAPISRIEQASKTRRCNLVRAQLVAVLTKSGALFQRSTETLQSHIDHKRLSTLLDMYNSTPSPRPSSPRLSIDQESAGATTPRPHDHRHPHSHSYPVSHDANTAPETDNLTLTASPTSELQSPLPSSFSQHIRQQSISRRRSNTMAGSRQNSRPSSYHEHSHSAHAYQEHPGLAFGRRTTQRHRTSWSASEGEDSDSGATSVNISPRSSTYSNMDSSPTLVNTPEMTTLERLRKNFQRMHVHRREFLCELLAIRRKSRKGRQGLNALKDYDRNWTVVRDVLQDGVAGIESLVDELSKVLDSELYTLPRIDTQGNKSSSSDQDKQLQPFVHRLALLEQHVRGVQAKLFICNEDIKETVQEEPVDLEKRRLLEMQYESISLDISMMASEWQLGKTALNHVFEPSVARPIPEEREALLLEEQDGGNGFDNQAMEMGPIIDSMELLEDQQRLMDLAAKREETWEASTEAELGGFASRRVGVLVGPDGIKMTRAERIAHQKVLREQEELRKERSYDNSKMVHELKDVLGRRRHLRENDDEQPQHQEQHGLTFIIPTGVPESSSSASSSSHSSMDVRGYSLETTLSTHIMDSELQQLSLEQDSSLQYISPFSLNAPVFSSEPNSSVTTLDQELAGQVEDSYIEISGVGEAEEDEETREE
ncbi:Mysoin-binding motif of peroxisomes-domain-containing protein [Gamsiella multidivaricata]|uniref:Mysoin-binding motif of peroxisomes-domain-containing protein n=1 Tax=Gamsiella multidivaricata TaxID=101098 RepID=UPI002220336E|nr:Mysoin-binding motif of peroxisomes-domain-containing protein [Gamsiella multidivaricata]KAG0366333.1 hypothetical protein BGZ54_005512 [Gamsiella multidivaricata]KAI7823848.1 Mysoin-binding motif of peroxisomes-domain-containing protein [Gamsiella multidivaricata]